MKSYCIYRYIKSKAKVTNTKKQVGKRIAIPCQLYFWILLDTFILKPFNMMKLCNFSPQQNDQQISFFEKDQPTIQPTIHENQATNHPTNHEHPETNVMLEPTREIPVRLKPRVFFAGGPFGMPLGRLASGAAFEIFRESWAIFGHKCWIQMVII